MSVREIRQKWPEAERALAREGEIIVTRDSKPVAKIVSYREPLKKRPRFDFVAHEKWLREFWKKQPRQTTTIDEELARDRADRGL